jgi:hypothetical protein
MQWALATSVRRTHAALLLSRAALIKLAGRSAARMSGAGLAAGARSHPRSSLGTSPNPRSGHVRAAARCRRPSSLARHAAGVSRWSAAAQQGDALPGRPTEDRGDRRRHAACRRRRPRPPVARLDRRAVARRPAHLRGARLAEADLATWTRAAARCSCRAARAAAAARSASTTAEYLHADADATASRSSASLKPSAAQAALRLAASRGWR